MKHKNTQNYKFKAKGNFKHQSKLLSGARNRSRSVHTEHLPPVAAASSSI